jgi:hypothetical protein
VFFFVLSMVFGIAARNDYVRSQRQWTLAAKARRRTAMSFGFVGLGLILWGATH